MMDSLTTPDPKSSRLFWFALGLPLFLAAVIAIFSPNFQTLKGERTNPLGGDFVQDWVGGHVVGTKPEKLYDLEHVIEVQHDPEIVGFRWPEKKYFPMVYPPFYYVAMWPFAKLNFLLAAKFWLIFSAVAVSVSAWLLHRFYPRCRHVIGVCLVACVVYTPMLLCFSMCQKSTMLLLILTGTFLLLHHQRGFAAGLVFGLIAFKPHLGILIGVTMLLKRQWGFAAGAISMVAVLVGASWIFQSNWWPDYLNVVSNMGDYVQTGGYNLADSHSLWGALQLTLGFLSPTVVKIVVGLVSMVVVFFLWRIARPAVATSSREFSVQFSAMIIATILLSPHFYTYDLTMLLLPMLLIVCSYDKGKWRTTSDDQAIGLIMVVLFGLVGLFGRVAGLVQMQPSIVLMMAILVLLGLSGKPIVKLEKS